MENPVLNTRVQPFLCLLAAIGLLALLYFLGPQQLPVVVYKMVMPLLGGFAGASAWLVIMPYANPSRYLEADWRLSPEADKPGEADFPIAKGYELPFCVTSVCVTLATCSGMLAVAWGL